MQIYILLLSRHREGREVGGVVCLFLLKCLQLKIIFTPKGHILGWHILLYLRGHVDREWGGEELPSQPVSSSHSI